MAEALLYRPSGFQRALAASEGFSDDHAPAWRSPFRRDYARLIHSAAFRRLQGKTQLFAGLESDFFRNRLTHSLEVAQIAKSITLKLNADRFEKSPLAQPTEAPPKRKRSVADWYADELAHSYRASRTAAENGFIRTALTSELVNRFVQAVDAELDPHQPPLSPITMREEERREVSVLKHLTYVLLIRSSRMRLVAHRAAQMVREIFGALAAPGGEDLLPPDVAERHRQAPSNQKKRVVCDYVAGMTDRYAVEFYARLTSETFYSMFKPH